MFNLRRNPMKSLVVAICVAGLASVMFAQDEPTPPPAAAEADSQPAAPEPAEQDELLAEWGKFNEQRLEIARQLQALGKEFQSAPVERKREIRDEYTRLIGQFNTEISPHLNELAPRVYERDPKNTAAGEIVMQQAFESMDFPRAAATADALIAEGVESSSVLNLGGSAHFAEHDFERAVELLSKAEAEQQLDPRSGERWLEPAREYIELWKTEQAIRDQEAAAPEAEQNPRAEFETSKGKIVMELYENQAPNTVANFVSLIENGTYDGVKFHRVIPNFMIQGGDPNSKDDDPSNDGLGGPGYTIKCECFEEDARMHFAGSLSMAHAGRDSGGSQFFITHLPTPHLNPNAERNSGHTVFGHVVEGLDVVRKIEKDDEITSAKILSKRDHEYKPETTPDAK
jgi:cyclophilin family peptidyl-prolyl cis-trans isomerase